ncbi:DUF2059 domain-containing protein [Nibricoccus sp. IMCC34717]|uniref:DUF2059 domain-containing protein n=1 Tax=Nibricoccus sp. IMCC34717 TaxID=3034021 RepID=UPI00384CEA54
MKKQLALATLLLLPLVRAEEPNAERLALAREVIHLSQADRMINNLVPQLQQMTSQMAAPMLDKLSPEQRAKVEAAQKKAVELGIEAAKQMISKMDAVYADVYSSDELKAIKSFYSTVEGKSMIEKMPQVMQKMMPLMQQMQAELMPKIQAAMAELQQELQPPAPPAPAAAAGAPAAADAPTVGLPAAK